MDVWSTSSEGAPQTVGHLWCNQLRLVDRVLLRIAVFDDLWSNGLFQLFE